MSLKIRRFFQLFKYGLKDAEAISKMPDVNLSKSAVFKDIVKCYLRYDIRSIYYKKEKVWLLSHEQREELGKKCQFSENWLEGFYSNHKFLIKWSSFKYEASPKLQLKRIDAYCRKYNLGNHCYIGHGVLIHRHHYSEEIIKTGTDCHISEDVNIDYTGGLTLGYKVGISEGAKIFTHNHVVDFSGEDEKKGCIKTPLVIHDRAWVGARVMIMPGVKEIGRGAVLSADSCVRKKVPPYAIVMGNPAKIVGFRLTPQEIVEREKELYPEEKRIPIEVLTNNYQKYFLDRKSEIKNLNKM